MTSIKETPARYGLWAAAMGILRPLSVPIPRRRHDSRRDRAAAAVRVPIAATDAPPARRAPDHPPRCLPAYRKTA